MKIYTIAVRYWSLLARAWHRFLFTDGPQWAAALAYYAFFSLFPLIVLFVTFASVFIERERATTTIIEFINGYLPLSNEGQGQIFASMGRVLAAREEAGALAILGLVWAATRFFGTLIRAANRAWGAKAYRWWRLPFKSLTLVVISGAVVIFAIVAPTLIDVAGEVFLPNVAFVSWVGKVTPFLLRAGVVFLALSLFYKAAQSRQTGFSEVWGAALFASVLLQASGGLFVIYLKYFAPFNAIYGTFGGIMALLLWIYISGCIFIFGACLCSERARTDTVAAGISSPSR